MSLTQAGDAIADALEKAAASTLEAALIADFPFLGWPFFQPLLNWFVDRELNKLKVSIEVAIYIVYSTAVVNNQVGDLNEAGAKLAKNPQDPEAIQAIIDAARKLGKLNNVN